jgi:hypothetical protein
VKIWVPVIKFKPIQIGGPKRVVYSVETSRSRPTKKRFKKAVLASAVVIIIAIGLLVLTVRSLNAPAEGTINNSIDTLAASKARTSGGYSGNYFSLKYPSGFKLITTQKSTGYLDSISLLSDDHPDIQVSVGLVKEPFASDSGLNYRQLHPELYTLVRDTNSSKVFSRDQNGAEFTGFISHDDKVLAISLTSVSSTHLQDDYDFLVNGLSWKQ